MRPIPASPAPARESASPTTGSMASRWRREAISGTTPPNGRWRSSWEKTTEESTSRPSLTTAAAVSSQEVSIPSVSKVHRLVEGEPAQAAAPRLLRQGGEGAGGLGVGVGDAHRPAAGLGQPE